MSTLTSANSVLYLAVAGVFPVAQKIEGYATDDAFAFEADHQRRGARQGQGVRAD